MLRVVFVLLGVTFLCAEPTTDEKKIEDYSQNKNDVLRQRRDVFLRHGNLSAFITGNSESHGHHGYDAATIINACVSLRIRMGIDNGHCVHSIGVGGIFGREGLTVEKQLEICSLIDEFCLKLDNPASKDVRAPKVASGKTFILGFFINHGPISRSLLSYELMIATESPTGASVTITTPLYNSTFIRRATIAHNQAVKIILDTTHSLAVSDLGIASKGILVESTDVVSVYGLTNEDSTADGFTVIPTRSLGMEYYATTWDSRSDILLVSTADGTNVDITLPSNMGSRTLTYNAVSYGAGDTISVTLNKFQTFNVYGSGHNVLLTGTHIVADKPISVLSGSQCDNVGSGYCDVLIQHILPVTEWGTKYFSVHMPSSNQATRYQIVTSQPNTDIFVNGVYDSTITLAGANVVKTIAASEYKTISSSKPTMVTMYSPGTTSVRGDPHMVMLTATKHFANSFAYLTPQIGTVDYTNYITIVVKDADKGGIKLDGSHINHTRIAPIEGSGGMVVMEASVDPGMHLLIHDDQKITFGAYAFGVHNYVSYGFFLT